MRASAGIKPGHSNAAFFPQPDNFLKPKDHSESLKSLAQSHKKQVSMQAGWGGGGGAYSLPASPKDDSSKDKQTDNEYSYNGHILIIGDFYFLLYTSFSKICTMCMY